MRGLTRQQKRHLYNLYKQKRSRFLSAEDLTAAEWEVLESMNDFETIWHHVDNFLRDLRMAGEGDDFDG